MSEGPGASSEPRARIPGPRGLWPVGSFFPESRDTLGFLQDANARYGDLFVYTVGRQRVCVLNHPDDVKRVLIDEAANFPKPAMPPSQFAGLGLFGSAGEFWKRHRRLIQPAFQREAAARWVDTIDATTDSMLVRWSALATSGSPVDIYEEMSRLAYRIQARICLTEEPDESIYQAMRGAIRHIGQRDGPWTELLFNALPMFAPWGRQMAAWMAPINAFISRELARRRKNPGERQDVLEMLMGVRDAQTGEGFSDTEVRDELMNVWGAGYEATGSALTWALFLLAKNPEARERLERESDGGAAFPLRPYAAGVFNEALRLFPPAWRLERESLQDARFQGVDIPANTMIFMVSYLLHRDPRYWKDPEAFRPERFDAGVEEKRPKCSYLPFGAGQRTCLGNHLALLEGPRILTKMTAGFRIEPTDARIPPLATGITLTPKGGLRGLLHLRASGSKARM